MDKRIEYILTNCKYASLSNKQGSILCNRYKKLIHIGSCNHCLRNGELNMACGCNKKKTQESNKVLEPVRESCLECVEKHVGSAWILIAEHRDGYPHKLLAVGHLHEAEDESQSWNDLHNTIREMRKAYQSDNKMPDFMLLSEMIQTIKDDLKD